MGSRALGLPTQRNPLPNGADDGFGPKKKRPFVPGGSANERSTKSLVAMDVDPDDVMRAPIGSTEFGADVHACTRSEADMKNPTEPPIHR